MDRRLLLILPYSLWFVFLVLSPFLFIFFTSLASRNELGVLSYGLHLDSFAQLTDPVYFSVLRRTFFLAGMNTAITICLAYPIAFFLSRIGKSESGFFLALLLIPFWTNFLIRLLAFMDVLRLHLFGMDWLFTWNGMLAALFYNYLPFAVLPLFSTLEKVPQSVLEAAQDLGASKRNVFFHVLWPMTKRGVMATSLLVFIPSLGEYLIPEIIGGGQQFFLGTFLQQQFFVSRNWPLGAAAIAILLVISIVLLRFGGNALLEENRT